MSSNLTLFCSDEFWVSFLVMSSVEQVSQRENIAKFFKFLR